ncbi:MAG: hypothetical protein GX259_07055 [Bacteroidales bacterium]|nr:hypothetical protein [Bacteroidales bacterium]
MKRKVLFFSILTLMLFYYTSFSQEKNLSIESLKSASYVFKGSVVSYIPFKSDMDNIWMMAYTIKIQKIYKGDDIKEGTIILITESVLGWSETEYGPISDNVSEYTTEERNKFAFGLGSGTTRMFFCNILKNNFSNLPKSNTDNSIVIEPIYKNRCYFAYHPDEKIINNKAVKFITIKGFGKEFTTEGEFIEFLKENKLISENSKKRCLFRQGYSK